MLSDKLSFGLHLSIIITMLQVWVK